ncbi:hypothetical protein ACIRJO_02580 [Streptomyces sp. NPDC102394]|uniref:hypothetical protein n=1 Tax=Streptomyces sp. NPDC102394 TaxID=3366167 RepID=UPI003826AA3B
MATQDTGPPAYGALIKLAREAKGWSPETAAKRMPYDFSGSSWRQIEAGYRGSGANRKRVPGKPSTVAAMAHTVGITSERLTEHHHEAAEVLREMERQDAQQAPAMPEALRNVPAHVKRMIDAALEDVDPRDVPEVLRQMAADYETVQAQRQRLSGPQRPRRTG